MNLSLQLSLLLGAGVTLIFVILVSNYIKMNIRYTVVWITWAGTILILSVFPELIDKIAIALSISTPVNAIFLIFIFLSYLMNYYLFFKVSQQNEQIKSLTYEIAKLRKENNEKK